MFLCRSFEVALHNLSSNQHFIILYWRLYSFLVMSSPFTHSTTFCICSYNTWIHDCNENETDSKVIHVRYRSLSTMKDKEHCGEIVKREREREGGRERGREGGRERGREADSCAYLLRSMCICYSSKYSFFILWVFATVANTHWNFEWVFATHNGYLLP